MKVFLSHASQDQTIAEEVSLALKGAGFDVFLDKSDLPPGGDHHARIREAISQSAYFIFLISPDSVARGRYTLSELKFAQERWAHPRDRVIPVMVRPTALGDVPAYVKAVTILQPIGNTPAEVASALRALAVHASDGSAEDRLFEAANDALQTLHDLDNAIRTVLGPLTRFDHTWSTTKREEVISAVETLADAEEILPRVRQRLGQLSEEASKPLTLTPEKQEAVDEVLACGSGTLQSLGESHVTPWPGPHELVMLLDSIRAAAAPDDAAGVRQQVKDVQSVVNRDRLREADRLIGRWRGGITQRS